MSLIRKPQSWRSFSSTILRITLSLSRSRSSPCVGIWWIATLNRGLTNLVPLPNSRSHSVLLRAVSANSGSLNRITYLVLVVPIPATCTSWVKGAFNNAVLMWEFAAGMGRYRPNWFSLLPASADSIGECLVLIRTQFWSLAGR
jgi:hypothetical protein